MTTPPRRVGLAPTPRGDETEDPSSRWFAMHHRVAPFSSRDPRDYPSLPAELLGIEYTYFLPFAQQVATYCETAVLDDNSFRRIRPEAKYKQLSTVLHLENFHLKDGLYTWEGFKMYASEFCIVRVLFEAHPASRRGGIRRVYVYERDKTPRAGFQAIEGNSPLTGLSREQARDVIFSFLTRYNILAPPAPEEP